MKATRKALAIVMALLMVTLPQLLQAAPHSREQYQQMYVEYLDVLGFSPTVDSDGDVQFRTKDRTYFIQVNDKDSEYFRIVLPNVWPIESDVERLMVYEAVNKANAQTKVAKLHTVGDNVWVGVELFVPTPEAFKAVFVRSLSAIDSGVDNFVEAMP